MLIADLLNKGFYELSQAEKETLLSRYEDVTGKLLCSTCTGSFITAYNELKRMSKKTSIPESTQSNPCKYGFKAGYEKSEIRVAGFHLLITAENLTDEIVETHLIDHPLIELKNA